MSGQYSIEQQKLIIQALISDRGLFSRCQSILQPEYFHQQYQKSIKFIVDFSNKYKSLPTPEQISADTGLELNLISDITPEHQLYFLDLVEEFCKHQALVNAVLKSADMLQNGEYGDIERSIKDALLVGLQKDLGTAYYADPKKRLQRLLDENGKLSTGWITLDKKLFNVGRGELMIFAAPPGGGKSVVLQNLAVNFSTQAYHVVVITCELSENLWAKRCDSMCTGIATTDIYKNLDDVDLIIKNIGKNSGSITIKQFKKLTRPVDIAVYLKEYQIQNGHPADMLIVDYLDLLHPNSSKINVSDFFVKDKFVSEELRAIALEFNLLAITASQLGRQAIGEIDLNQSHLAGGISKANTADNLIGIYNNSRSRERGEIEFIILKCRNGGSVDQKLTMRYDINTLRITDMDGVAPTKPTSTSIMDRIKRKTVEVVDPQTGEVKEVTQSSSIEKVDKGNVDPVARAQNLHGLINRIKGKT